MENLALVEEIVVSSGYRILSRNELSNGTGTKYTLFGGGYLTVYKTGRYQIQGRLTTSARQALSRALKAYDPR